MNPIYHNLFLAPAWKKTQIDNANRVGNGEWILLESSVITELNSIKSSHDLYTKGENICTVLFYANHQEKVLKEKTLVFQWK
jgi:hypothetical protein